MNFDALKANASLIQTAHWSHQLKSDKITIDQHTITLTQPSHYDQFTLLDCGFQHTYKRKQAWTLNIKKKTGGIEMGICLKNQIKKKNFNSQNIKWEQTGHGLYIIGGSGFSISHSQSQYHRQYKSFKLQQGDSITVEYDPIGWKVRFIKNGGKVEKFEMPIWPPPEDDCYHPCVLIAQANDSVEMTVAGSEPVNSNKTLTVNQNSK